MIEQRPLQSAPALGIPVRRHHVGEVVRGHADAPDIPIEKPHVRAAVARQEVVPDVGVAVDDCDIAARVDARKQTGCRLDESLVQIAPFARQTVAEPVAEGLEMASEALQHLLRGFGIRPRPDRDTETRIIPPRRMQTRPRVHDALALLDGRRQRPRRDDVVRLGQVFEQQVPLFRIRIADGVEAARHQPRRHRGRDCRVELDFAAAAARQTVVTAGEPGLEDQGVRRACGIIISQPQPGDARKQCRTRALDRDLAHAPVAEHAASAQRIGEIPGVGRHR